MPAADIRPNAANLLLTGSPDFLHVMKMFFDGPSRGSGLQNVADIDLSIGAKVRRPATIVKAHNHNADDAA